MLLNEGPRGLFFLLGIHFRSEEKIMTKAMSMIKLSSCRYLTLND